MPRKGARAPEIERNLELCAQAAYTVEFAPPENLNFDSTVWLYISGQYPDTWTARLCVAGMVCMLAGDVPVPPSALPASAEDGWMTWWVLPAGTQDDWVEADRVYIPDRARQLLGISESAAEELFAPINTKTRIVHLLNQLAEGKPEDQIDWHLGGFKRGDFPDNAVGVPE